MRPRITVRQVRLRPAGNSKIVKKVSPASPRQRGGSKENPMKKLVLIIIAMTCLPVLAAGQLVEEIVTRVNNQIITLSEYQRSKDQLRDDIKQQDPANADKLYAEREKDVLRD